MYEQEMRIKDLRKELNTAEAHFRKTLYKKASQEGLLLRRKETVDQFDPSEK